MTGNYLGPEGLLELSPGIAATKTLEILDLSACGLGRPIFVRSSKASLHAKSEVLEAWAVFVAAVHANLFSVDQPVTFLSIYSKQLYTPSTSFAKIHNL